MPILLCAATAFELQPTLDELPRYGPSVEVLVTGVGLMETAWTLSQRLATGLRPTLLLQAGIAGLLDPGMGLATTVAVQQETIGDLGVEEKGGFRSTFALGFGDPDAAPWRGGWLRNESALLQECGLPAVRGVSVNEISTSEARIRYYREALGAVSESMEGAAFHYCALRAGLPFLQLRSFSNHIGERNKERWQLRNAINALNDHLRPLLDKLVNV